MSENVSVLRSIFFSLNTALLTDTSQMLNLDELARVANKYRLSVKVTGAADSSTGTPVLNESLSASRADFIVAELEKTWYSVRTDFQGQQRWNLRPYSGRGKPAYKGGTVFCGIMIFRTYRKQSAD